MNRQTFALLSLASVTLLGCADGLTAGDAMRIPDSVLLSSEDLGGAQPAPGGPDPTVHQLPPRPCAGSTPPAPSAERVINARYERYQVYQYVARYPSGEAANVVDDLRWQLARCARPTAGERYQVLSQDTAGVLFLREYRDGDAVAAYYVGYADEYLVAVLEVGASTPNGDPTIASGLGRTAVTRAGGATGEPVPSSAPARWSSYQAEVTGVRRGPDPRTLLIDVELGAGHPECARNPKVGYYEEATGHVHANVVYESARSEVVGGCPTKAAGVAMLKAAKPVGDRIVVLNQQPWAPDGARYRRCDAQLGCTPPADHCDPAWVHAARDGMDVPRNSAHDVEHCAGGWLVMTVNVNSTACGAGGRPGCSAPPAVTRYFLRFHTGWQVFAQTRAGGCAAVLKAEPAFPRAACEKLPRTQ